MSKAAKKSHPVSSRSERQGIFDEAKKLLDAGKPDRALALLSPLAENARRDPELYYYLGYANVLAGNLWEAAPHYRKALDLSGDPALWGPLGILYTELGLRMLGRQALRLAQRHHSPYLPPAEEVEAELAQTEADLQIIAQQLKLPVNKAEEGLRLMEEGQLALHQGAHARCILLNRQAAKILGDFPPPHNNLALALFFHGQPQEAIRAARDVLQRYPDNIHALANLVRFMAWGGQPDEARTVWERLKAQTHAGDELQFKLIEAGAIMDDDETVLRLSKQLVGEMSDERRVDAQIQLFQAIAEANLGKPAAQRHLAELQADSSLAQATLEALKKGQTGLGWAPRFPYFTPGDLLPRVEFETFMDLLARQGKLSGKQRHREMVKFVERFPQLVLVAQKIILENQQPEPGIEMLGLIGTPAAYAVLRAFGQGQAGSDTARRQALFALLEAGQIQPGEQVRMWIEGKWQEVELRTFKITEDARQDYSPAVEALLSQGQQAVHENRKSKAEKLFKQALKLDPQAVEAYNNLGTIYANRGEVEQAKAMFEQALAINPLYVLARCNLAMFALNEEKIEAAETLLSPLGELQEITPLGMVFLSFVRARLAVFKEQYAEARDNLKVALEINPDYAPAKDLLQRLDEIETISRGFAVWKERMARSHKALRTRQQSKLATNAPTLAEALNVYTKEVMTGMARAILPWGGWSTLKKAELTGYLVRELPTAMVLKHILADLRPAELSALRQVLANGGWLAWQTFEATYGNDQEESPYWQYHEPETVMGRLRLRGLLVETHADGELVLTVPVELRQPLQDYLPAEGGQEQT